MSRPTQSPSKRDPFASLLAQPYFRAQRVPSAKGHASYRRQPKHRKLEQSS